MLGSFSPNFETVIMFHKRNPFRKQRVTTTVSQLHQNVKRRNPWTRTLRRTMASRLRSTVRQCPSPACGETGAGVAKAGSRAEKLILVLRNGAAGNYRNLREIGLSVENSVVDARSVSDPRTDLATESVVILFIILDLLGGISEVLII